MAYHKLESIVTESEQMYLITVVRLEEEGATSPIPLSALAGELGVQPVSVHQMARKLEEGGLAAYIPYKGIELTQAGRRVAAQILRNRRLWEVFIVEHLNLPFAEAHAFSCMVEHITSPKIAGRLSQFLGDPTVSPQGKLIPPVENPEQPLSFVPLSHLSASQRFQVARIEATDTDRLFLKEEGLYPGAPACVRSVGSRGAVLLETVSGSLYISQKLAATILVQLVDEVPLVQASSTGGSETLSIIPSP
jgi:DtxR family transcriptional regulator, Mn-dependent transcriptional regulator